VPLADFRDAISSISTWDDWCPAWAAANNLLGIPVAQDLARTPVQAGLHLTDIGVAHTPQDHDTRELPVCNPLDDQVLPYSGM